jgi:hypothetical protein
MMRTYHETSNSMISFPRLHIKYLAHAQKLGKLFVRQTAAAAHLRLRLAATS